MRILRDALCAVCISMLFDDDDEKEEKVECLINFLFIVVRRSSSSDTKHQLQGTDSHPIRVRFNLKFDTFSSVAAHS